ncbi:MAG: hypothetical protein WAN03_09625, partial [Candidatus Sulfotelmatobacter sp.]
MSVLTGQPFHGGKLVANSVLRRVVRCALSFVFCSQFALSLFAQLSTQDHLTEPGFWPTQPAAARSEYVGSGACASCHAAKLASQRQTPMGENSMHAADSDILHSHPELKFANGPYRYEIKTDARHSVYTVTDGTHTLAADLLWAFGTGRAAQS